MDPVLPTTADRHSSDFAANAAHHRALAADLRDRLAIARRGGGEAALARQRTQGKLNARERIDGLIDPGSPFLELSPLAAAGLYHDEAPAAGIITGIGRISGRDCLILANDATVKGGTYFPLTVKKHLRAQQIALENRLPCFYLVDSGGAFLPLQDEVFPDADDFGRIFYNQATMSAAGIPQISAVMGSCTAGGAYVPAMSDETVIVQAAGTIFLGGPPLVKMATGEEVDDETLGGTAMHARTSGLADYVAENDADAIRIGRAIMARLNWQKTIHAHLQPPEAPHYDPDELLGIVPIDTIRQPLDMREVLARLLDGSRLLEFKPDYGDTLVCGHAHLNGFPVGILANNGVLFSSSANKAAQFIQLCNQSRTPLIYLQNITGFMVGSQAEHEGIVKHGSKMINAVANSTVPQFTVLIGGSYGAGNYAMCGRAYDPRLLLAWPTSRIAVMGAEQAAGVLAIITEEAARKRGGTADADTLAVMKAMTIQKFTDESDPYFATARLWDDGLIDPRQTRMALTVGLSMSYNRDWGSTGAPHYGTFRM